FWAPRLEINRKLTIPSQRRQCEETGRIDNFRRASGRKNGEFQGIYFNDSDVYKWIEAAAFSLAGYPDPDLEAALDAVIEEIAAAQGPDGYLNSYFSLDRQGERWTNLRDMHELYCAGHLIQAAIAHHRATGKTSLLDVACRFADHIGSVFGPDARPGTPGHEEIEMALVELYRGTGQDRYLKLAAFFIEKRGSKPPLIGGSAYHQDHLPFRDQTEMVGHAVRAVYLNCGAADLYLETGEKELSVALDRLWSNMTGRRIYVTGGLGSRYEGEAFGRDYELPNDRAYTESCAAIGSIMWNWRMLSAAGEARYADLMETALYNGMLAGLSLDGQHYFYQNPLEDDGHHRRAPWFGCACCPPNLSRMLSSLPGYCYSVSAESTAEGNSEGEAEGAWIHLYIEGAASLTLPGRGRLSLVQRTRYPWEENVEIEITEAPATPAALRLRIPAWCSSADVSVNGGVQQRYPPGEYAALTRQWKRGDRVVLSLPMPVRLVESHPRVTSNHGQVAICRGPLVYCLEAVDNPGVD
ncbi:MAG: glycoside hydrolase family 127 protein, partial [Chloroflexi bacterium]|nr:glycoside hydrolase family 127 protein [Chloroflexota bacterium]